jgi:cyclopropane fatty-acyl-phospholipid synthase-like methyltransferase
MDISPSVTRTRAYEITDSEFQRMSWHQRQRFLTTLRAELGRLQDDTRKAAEMNRRRQERREWWRIELTASVERIREEAAQILAGLPPDPDAAKHRDALRTRYDRKANHE